ncbi:MAG: hypothetical protein MKZ75_04570, partial [Acidimicrobiales bacterium]|nr:hypothetical protein [Acidimicrobiales bacterium]
MISHGNNSAKHSYIENIKTEMVFNRINEISTLDRMIQHGQVNIQYLINNQFVNNNNREWLSLGITDTTNMMIIGVGDSEWSFGVTAVNYGGSSDMVTVDGCTGDRSLLFQARR